MRRTVKRLSLHWYGLNAAALLLLAVFAYGVAVGTFRLPPYGLLETAAAGLRDWVAHPLHNARMQPEKFLQPLAAVMPEMRAPARGAYPGLTFVTGLFGESLGMRLLDMHGRVVHEWRVSFNDIWPEAPHMDAPRHDWDIQIHGVHLYPNGDVVFNFQYGGLVKIDACSRPLWKLAAQTHHSVFEAEDGTLWVPSRRRREEPLATLPSIPPPFWEELILEVSPDGKVLSETSILDVITRSGFEGLLFATGAHGPEIAIPFDGDFTHLNEVEVLGTDQAARFPLFAAGDVVVSLRNLNLLLVLDGADKSIKWWMVGPFLRQHDPDFTDDGKIAVFDNRRDGAAGQALGGSRILEIDPQTRAVGVRYEGSDDAPFFTETMGEQQYLPNGNVLVTESEAGRVFEVTPEGRIVWSWVNRWDETHAAAVGRAVRLPASYAASIAKEDCDD